MINIPDEWEEVEQPIAIPDEWEEVPLPSQQASVPESDWANAPDLRDPEQVAKNQESYGLSDLVGDVGSRLWEGVKGVPYAAQQMIEPALQGLTLKHSDELRGLAEVPFRAVQGDLDVGRSYTEGRDRARENYKQSQEVAPVGSFIAEMSSGILPGSKLFNAIKNPNLLKTLGLGALEGTAIGQGAKDEGLMTSGETLKSAAFGAGGAGAGYGIAKAFSPKASNKAIVDKAREVDWPLTTADITDSKFVKSAEDILDYTVGTPYIKDLNKRQDILNKQIYKSSGIRDKDRPNTIQEIYKQAEMIQNNQIRRAADQPAKVAAREAERDAVRKAQQQWTQQKAKNKAKGDKDGIFDIIKGEPLGPRPKLPKKLYNAIPERTDLDGDILDAILAPGIYNKATGEIDIKKFSNTLAELDYNRFGPNSQDPLKRTLEVAEKFPPLDPKIRRTGSDKTASILGQTALSGLGYGLGGSVSGAVLTPIGLTQMLKGSNYLSRSPNTLNKFAPLGAGMASDDYESWDTMDYVTAGLMINPALKAGSAITRTALGKVPGAAKVPMYRKAIQTKANTGFKALDNAYKKAKILERQMGTATSIARPGAVGYQVAEDKVADEYNNLMQYIDELERKYK